MEADGLEHRVPIVPPEMMQGANLVPLVEIPLRRCRASLRAQASEVMKQARNHQLVARAFGFREGGALKRVLQLCDPFRSVLGRPARCIKRQHHLDE